MFLTTHVTVCVYHAELTGYLLTYARNKVWKWHFSSILKARDNYEWGGGGYRLIHMMFKCQHSINAAKLLVVQQPHHQQWWYTLENVYTKT